MPPSSPPPGSALARHLRRLPSLLLRVDLRQLILGLAMLAVVITFGNTFWAGYTQQRELLIRNTLDANEAYATKMASLTDSFLQQALSQLAYSAQVLGQDFDNARLQNEETRRLLQQNQTFNSVLVVDAVGKVVNISPPITSVLGTQVSSEGLLAALQSRQPLVSEPFITTTKRLVLFISQPIYGASGEFVGFIGGTVYLHEKNGLHSVLGEHHYQNGSYLFVVDRQGNLIFHRDQERVGQNVLRNSVVKAVLTGETGSAESINTLNQHMLSGYAPVSSTGWGVVVQRPTDLTLELLTEQVTSMSIKVAPLLLLTLLGIWLLARMIAHPLHDLAKFASTLDEAATSDRITSVPSWYYEVIKLKYAILTGLTLVQRKILRLNQETMTDPLTGLLNRRGMDETLQSWVDAGLAFSVVSIDIDRFKGINDTHGHDVGDIILKFLSDCMRQSARVMDVACRPGGDEFILLLPDTPADKAMKIAERLAKTVASQEAAPSISITLSMGIAGLESGDDDVNRLLKTVDVALYEAKQRGRNRIVQADAAI